MAAVLLVSFYLSKEENANPKTWYWNLFAWFAGFIAYQVTVNLDSIFLGPTLLAVIISAILTYVPIFKNKYKISNI